MSKDNKKEEGLIEGTIAEALPNALFRIEVEGEDDLQLGYLAGKMRMYRIKVLVGDTVLIKPDPYGGRARIVRRL